MIKSRLRVIIAEEEARRGERLTYTQVAEEAGLAKDTVNRLANNDTVRIDFPTLDALCRRFGCQVGDILVYVAE